MIKIKKKKRETVVENIIETMRKYIECIER